MPRQSIETVDFTHPRNVALAAGLRKVVRGGVERVEELEEIPPLLVAIALTQVAREYLNKYPEKQRAMIVDQIIAPFLLNEKPVTVDEQKLVTLV